MECVGLPNREVDSGSMVPLNCTTQGGPVHIVAAFTLAQQDPGTQRTFPFSSPCLSLLGFFWSWLHPHSWREASFTQLGRCPQQPQAYLSLWGMGHPNWIGPGLGHPRAYPSGWWVGILYMATLPETRKWEKAVLCFYWMMKGTLGR